MSEKYMFCEESFPALCRLGLRMLIYALLFGGLAAGMLQGAVTFGPEFYSELGPVEILESVFALTTALFFLMASRRDPRRAPLAILLTGFFLCLYIRESDYFFDLLISRHAWKAGVLIVLILTGLYAWSARKKLLESICLFVNHPSSGIFLSGFMVLLIFSRLFGCGDYWEGLILDGKWFHVKELVQEHTSDITYTLLMEDKCLTIKRVVEESAEQIGYFLMAISSFEYLRDARRVDLRTKKETS